MYFDKNANTGDYFVNGFKINKSDFIDEYGNVIKLKIDILSKYEITEDEAIMIAHSIKKYDY